MTKIGAITPKTTTEILTTLRIADENRRFLIKKGVKTAADTFGKTLLDRAYENYNKETIEKLKADGEKTAAEIHGATWLDIVNEKINNCLMQLFSLNEPNEAEIKASRFAPKLEDAGIQLLTAQKCKKLLQENEFETAAELYGETGLDFVIRNRKDELADGLRRIGAKTAAEIHGATVMDLVNTETHNRHLNYLVAGI